MLSETTLTNRVSPAPQTRISPPASEPQRQRVRDHLQRILASPSFLNSKRYAAVLTYIVEQTLEGAGPRLKERTIGIDVFQRPPDYDTSTDHVVRSAIAEVRKRLAQYYQIDTESDLRIEVLPGCYEPQFLLSSTPAPLPPSSSPSAIIPPPRRMPSWRWLALSGALLALVSVIICFVLWQSDPIDAFWHPVFASSAPVLLCVGNLEGGHGAPPNSNPELNPHLTLEEYHRSSSETILFGDASTMAQFTALLQTHHKQVRLVSQSDATFTDLQNGPAVLIGLMNNDWSRRLIPQLRYTVEHTSYSRMFIRDRNQPNNQSWAVDYATRYMDLTRDYALILRMVDPKTEQVVVVAAGLTSFGTVAAGEFLTNANEMRKLTSTAPRGWQDRNLEIVISTDVIGGRSGPANVLALYSW